MAMDQRKEKVDTAGETSKGLGWKQEDLVFATILMLPYLIEVAVQIFVIVDSVSWNWFWTLSLGWLVTSTLFNLMSVILVFQGMDFSGRQCGKLLCYLMHILLLGFVWRYLKISLAYEKPDAEEFFKLRKLQILMQALPLQAIHIAYLISPHVSHQNTLLFWMATLEICCSIISLCFLFDEKPTPNVKVNVNLAVARVLLLISRVIAIGILLSLINYFSVLVIVIHLAMSVVWMLVNKSKSKSEVAVKNLLLMFWDVRDFSLPVFLVLVENVAILIFHWRHSVFLVCVSGSCLLCGCVMCLVASIWYKCHNFKDNKGLPVVVDLSKNSRQHQDSISTTATSQQNAYHSGYMQSIQKPDQTSSQTPAMLAQNYTSSPSEDKILHTLSQLLNYWALKSCVAEEDSKTEILMETEGSSPNISVHQISSPNSLRDVKIEKSAEQTFSPWNNSQTAKELRKSCSLRQCDSRGCCNHVSWSVGSLARKAGLETFSSDHEARSESLGEKRETRRAESGLGLPRAGRNETIVNSGPCRKSFGKIDESLMTGGEMRSVEKNALLVIASKVEEPKAVNAQDHNVLSSSNTTKSIHSSRSSQDPGLPIDGHKLVTPELKIESSSPLVIKKASKIHLKGGNVNKCDEQMQRCAEDMYEKLIEDAYGILIYSEGENSDKAVDLMPGNRKLRVLCAKCLGNHDPLLSHCFCQNVNSVNKDVTADQRGYTSGASETTEYPTDTELPEDQIEEMSVTSTHLSTIPCSNTTSQLPIQFSQILNFPLKEFRKEFTSLEYVTAWLLMNQEIQSNAKRHPKSSHKHQHSSSYGTLHQFRFQPPPKNKIHPTHNVPVFLHNNQSSQWMPYDRAEKNFTILNLGLLETIV